MHEQLKGVTHELRCVRCKHVLRGLLVTANCPECGTLVMHTLVETLDVPSQALARPVHPRRLAWSMLAVAIGLLISIVGVTAPMVGRTILALLDTPLPVGGTIADRLGVFINALGTVVLLIGSLLLSRRDDTLLQSETGRADRWLLAGLGIWTAAVGIPLVWVTLKLRSPGGTDLRYFWFICGAVQLVGASIGAVGLRKYVTVLGRRCRRFRHAGSARQSIEAMVIVAAIGLVASLGAMLLSPNYPTLAPAAHAIYFISAGLLLMGAIYMVINFGWIYKILTSPPPQLEEVIKVVVPMTAGESAN